MFTLWDPMQALVVAWRKFFCFFTYYSFQFTTVLPNMADISTALLTETQEAIDLGNGSFSNAKTLFSEAHCFQNAISDMQAFFGPHCSECEINLQL